MDAGSTRFYADLKERVQELAASHMRYLNDGAAQDFADYRGRVSYLKALGDVLRLADEIATEKEDR